MARLTEGRTVKQETSKQLVLDESKQAEPARDLGQERMEFERMMERQSLASRQYTMGKLLSA